LIDGLPEFEEMYGDPFAITESGNSQAVASRPAPPTDEILENPPAETGASMCALFKESIVS
jgi:hypothetical protein